jgi:tRNA-specific 2-thiouridylase
MSKGRVLVAMSGGVDSSVAASLLVDQGYEVIGATMQVWDYSNCDIEEGNGTCCSSLDVDDARSVADHLGIPFYVLNCETQFKEAVIDPFVQGYLNGQTPLPCVNCNTFLKFDHLVRKMKELECDFLSTGHYAQIQNNAKGVTELVTSEDSWKDQTYFLFTMNPELLPKLLFPIGHMNKTDVRKYAEDKGLIVARKKDSTGICFVGNQGYDNFIASQVSRETLKALKGELRRFPTGEIMGQHEGIHHYTYGQSKGLGLDHHEKLFVLKIDPETKTVWIGDEKYLFKSSLNVERAHFLQEFENGERLNVKIRYQHRGSPGRVIKDGEEIRIEFDEPQRAVTPGQAAVIYRGRALVGGGWIRP